MSDQTKAETYRLRKLWEKRGTVWNMRRVGVRGSNCHWSVYVDVGVRIIILIFDFHGITCTSRKNSTFMVNSATNQVAHPAGWDPGFCSMIWLGLCLLPPGWDTSSSQVHTSALERFSMTFTANDKRQKWNFCRLSSALCTVESKYLNLLWIVRDYILFLCDLFKDYKERIENQR